MDVTKEGSKALVKKYEVELPGVPHLTVLDGDGTVLANVKPSEQFSVSGVLDPNLIRGFLEKWAGKAGRGN